MPWALLLVFAGLLLVDCAALRSVITASRIPAGLGYLLMSAGLLSVAAGLVFAAAGGLGRLAAFQGRRRRLLFAGLVTLPVTLWFATVLTEGRGISASPWFAWVFVAAASAPLGVVLLTVAAWSRLERRSWRMMLTVLLALLVLACFSVTTFHPVMYARPHRFFIGFGTLAAFALARIVTGDRGALGGTLLFALLVGVVAFPLAAGQTRFRTEALFFLYHESVIAQKLQPLLVTLVPNRRISVKVATEVQALGYDQDLPAATPGRYAGYDVLLFTADAFRADRILDRAVPGLTPNLDRIANESVLFQNAISNASFTLPTLRTWVSGFWASKEYVPEGDPLRRLANALRAQNYRSISIKPRTVHFQVIRGFDHSERTSDGCMDVVRRLRIQLEKPDPRPTFSWIHTLATHNDHEFEPEDLRFLGDDPEPYNAAVRHVDRCFAKALEVVKEHRNWDRTIVIFLSDHGEALGDHGRDYLHGTCYLHDLHVPMFVRLPDQRERRDVRYRIQSIDVLPTLSGMLGLQIDKDVVVGRDFTGLFFEDAEALGVGWALSDSSGYTYPCTSLMAEQWHLIHHARAAQLELYDMEQDPEELHNLAGERTDIVDRLAPVLFTHRDRSRY